jgi:hypothetical protein
MPLAARHVVLRSVRIEHGHDPDLAAVDDRLDARISGVVIRQELDQVQRHLIRRSLARMRQAVDENLRLVFVGGYVVRDLDAPDFAALVALTDRELHGDARVRGDRGVDDLLVLRVRVVVLETGRFDRIGGSAAQRNDQR